MNNQIIEESCKDIRDALDADIVSIGEAFQFVHDIAPSTLIASDVFKSVLDRLLRSEIEVGCAINPTGKYVEFVAWKGSVQARIERLLQKVSGHADWQFAAWLALKVNIDRYET